MVEGQGLARAGHSLRCPPAGTSKLLVIVGRHVPTPAITAPCANTSDISSPTLQKSLTSARQICQKVCHQLAESAKTSDSSPSAKTFDSTPPANTFDSSPFGNSSGSSPPANTFDNVSIMQARR